MDVISTTCCVAGAGPAGALLALLLARGGVDVVLLEQHTTWDREFRGEGVQPGSIDLFEELGLLPGVLALPHQLIDAAQIYTEGNQPLFAGSLRSTLAGRRHPYLMLLPQSPFLAWLTAEATATGRCRLITGAAVRDLVVTGAGAARRVVGVRYRGARGAGEVRARVVVGCDGRYSVVRKEAAALGIQTTRDAPPIDVIWAAVPRDTSPAPASDHLATGGIWLREHPEPGLAFFIPTYGADGLPLVQLGWTIPHGAFPALKERGFAAWQHDFVQAVPDAEPALEALGNWHGIGLLSVVVQRASPWWVHGLILLGDAVHTASPVGGQGLNLALADAAVAAEVLLGPLGAGLDDAALDLALARIERRREPVARAIMRFQAQFPRFLALPRVVRHAFLGLAPHLGRLAGDRAKDVVLRMAYGFREGWDGPVQ